MSFSYVAVLKETTVVGLLGLFGDIFFCIILIVLLSWHLSRFENIGILGICWMGILFLVSLLPLQFLVECGRYVLPGRNSGTLLCVATGDSLVKCV